MSPAALGRLFRRFGSSEAILFAAPEQLAGIPAERAASAKELAEAFFGRIEGFAEEGIEAIPIESPRYPQGLLDLRTPPMVIFLSGEIKPEDSRAIAIVGTRSPSREGFRAAREIARRCAAAGFCVVSGLARGIDTAAHGSTLLAGGRTIAILGNGLLDVYPPENRSLAARIRRQGALVSELWPEEGVSRRSLLARDRLQAAMSLAVLVVQAHVGCGSLTTARYAISCRRPLFALKWEEEPFASGAARLRQIGAKTISADDLEEVFRLLDTGPRESLFTTRS
jgi:DNA processing protein